MNFENMIKKLKMEKVQELDIIYYSKEAFLKCKCGTEADYYDTISPEDIAYDYITELKNNPLKKVIFGVIDDEYFKYLKDNNLVDNNDERIRYCQNLSDTKRKQLWKKNDFNLGYDFGILPFIMLNPDPDKNEITNYCLSDITIEKIKKIVINNFNNYRENTFDLKIKDVYISPYILN